MKAVCFVSCVILAISVCLCGVYGDLTPPRDIVTSGTCGYNCKWVYNETTHIIKFNGTGAMKDYVQASDVPWHHLRPMIANFEMNGRITNLCQFAFNQCNNLTEVVIPDSVKSLGAACFSFCANLTSITFPENLTSIGSTALRNIPNLKEIKISENNPSYRSINGVLFNKAFTTIITHPCGRDSSYTIPDGITAISSNCFSTCDNFESINIPKSVKDIYSSAFSHCYGLKSITIPEGVTEFREYTFSGCATLTSVSLPNTLTKIGPHTFWNCSALTSIVIPESVTTISQYAFSECPKLKSVNIPHNVKTINSDTFRLCKSLTSIVIPKNVTTIDSTAFSGCTNLKSVAYQGSFDPNPSQSVFTGTSLSLVCVPDDYNSTTFCGANVSNDSSCSGAMENACYKAEYDENKNEWSLREREESIAWKKKESGCASFVCYNDTGLETQTKCDATSLCIDDKCTVKEKEESEVSIIIGIKDTNFGRVHSGELLNTLCLKTELNTNDMKIAIKINEQGNVGYIVVYVKNKENAGKIMTTINNVKGEGEECDEEQYGILCQVTSADIETEQRTLSISNSNQELVFATLMLTSFAAIIAFIQQ